jgi:hypothetical protein
VVKFAVILPTGRAPLTTTDQALHNKMTLFALFEHPPATTVLSLVPKPPIGATFAQFVKELSFLIPRAESFLRFMDNIPIS